MLALVCGDMRNGGEDIGGVRSGALDAVSVVNASLSGFSIHIKVLEVIVEVDRASTEVATEKGGMRGENGGHVDAAPLAERYCYTCKPLVELDNDGPLLLMEDILPCC